MRLLPAAGVVGAAIALVLGYTPADAQRVPERFGDRAALRSGAATVRPAGAPVRPAPGTDSRRSRGIAGELLLGTVGSAVGFWGGAALGVLYYDNFESPCGCEDPAQGQAIVGALAGSIVGTALGTHFGARADGGPGGHLARRFA
ncbi:MAG: hypothetical protein ABSB58_07165, partial [Gemmatimonadales bacterium]